MQRLGNFFDKTKSKIAGEVQNRVFIIEIIKKQVGIDLEMSDITISSGILRMKTSQIVKNEIFIKKREILKEINQKIKPKVIGDIK